MAQDNWIDLGMQWWAGLPYGEIIDLGILLISAGLLQAWGGLLLHTLRRSPRPRALLLEWSRIWVMPLLIIGVGLLLLSNGSHTRVGRWLDRADMWAVRFVMAARPAPAATSSLPGGVPLATGALLRCPGTCAGLEVQGCLP